MAFMCGAVGRSGSLHLLPTVGVPGVEPWWLGRVFGPLMVPLGWVEPLQGTQSPTAAGPPASFKSSLASPLRWVSGPPRELGGGGGPPSFPVTPGVGRCGLVWALRSLPHGERASQSSVADQRGGQGVERVLGAWALKGRKRQGLRGALGSARPIGGT